jgi:hypothetical protein
VFILEKLTLPIFNRHRQVLFSWIAILAILLNTLMPMLSHAMEAPVGKPGTHQSAWIELCSVTGSSWVRLGADGSILEKVQRKPLGAPASAHSAHCNDCLTHANSFGLLSPPSKVSFDGKLFAGLAFPIHSRVDRHVAWLAPAVRAPPSLS